MPRATTPTQNQAHRGALNQKVTGTKARRESTARLGTALTNVIA